MPRVATKQYSARLPSVRLDPGNIQAPARAAEGLNQAIGGFTRVLDRIGQENFNSQVAEHRVRVNDKFNEASADYLKRTGDHATQGMNEYNENYDDFKNSLTDNIDNEEVKTAVGRVVDENSSVFKGKLAMHMVTERRKHNQTVLANLQASEQDKISGSINPAEIDLSISVVIDRWKEQHPDASSEEIKAAENKVNDGFYLTHAREMATDKPNLFINYYEEYVASDEGKRSIIENRVGETVLTQMHALYKSSKLKAKAAENAAKNGLRDKSIFAVNEMTRKIENEFMGEEVMTAAQGYYDLGYLGENGAPKLEELKKGIDRKVKEVIKLREDKDIFYGVVPASSEKRKTAINSVFSEHMRKAPAGLNTEQYTAYITDFLNSDRVTSIPEELKNMVEGASSSNNQDTIKSSLMILNHLNVNKPNLVPQFAKNTKQAIFWKSLMKRTGFGREDLMKKDITADLEIVRENVFHKDPDFLKKLKKDFNKDIPERNSITAKAQSLFRSIQFEHSDVEGVDAVWARLFQGDIETPQAALKDYQNLWRSAYIYTDGDKELAYEIANDEFKRVYGAKALRAKEARAEKRGEQ